MATTKTTAVKIAPETHALLRRLALDLGPAAGKVVTLDEITNALAVAGAANREPVLAALLARIGGESE